MRIVALLLFFVTLNSQYLSEFKLAKSTIDQVVISNNLKLVAIANEKEILIKRTENGKTVQKLTGFATKISKMVFHKNSRVLAAGTESGVIHVYDLESGKMSNSFKAHNNSITDLIIHPTQDWVISASSDKSIQITKYKNGKKVNSLYKHDDTINDLELSLDGRKLISAGDDGKIILWSLEKMDTESVFKKKNHQFKTATFTDNNKRFVSINELGTIQLWDIESEDPKSSFKTNETSHVFIFTTPHNDKIIIAYGDKKEIDFIDINKWTVERKIVTEKKFTQIQQSFYQMQLITNNDNLINIIDIEFIMPDRKKIERKVRMQYRDWIVKGPNETKKEQKKRTGKKKTRAQIDLWLDEAITFYGTRKYEYVLKESIKRDVDLKTNVVKLSSDEIDPIYIQLESDEMNRLEQIIKTLKMKNATYFYNDKSIILGSCEFVSPFLKQTYKYDYEAPIIFNGKKIKQKIKRARIELLI